MFQKTFYPSLKKEMKLYHLAKREQWDAEVDVNWDRPWARDEGIPEDESRLMRQDFCSQLFLGEQGAFGLCGQILNMIPDMEAKLYVGTQIVDEARHVEAFAKYADYAGGFTTFNPLLIELLTGFVEAETYEEKIVGMQVFVEGMILEVFKSVHKDTPCPIMREMLELIIKDESRHANFGVLYLSKKMRGASPALKRQVEDSISKWAQQFANMMQWENPDVPRGTAEMQARRLESRAEIIQNGVAGLQERLGMIGLELRSPAAAPA